MSHDAEKLLILTFHDENELILTSINSYDIVSTPN